MARVRSKTTTAADTKRSAAAQKAAATRKANAEAKAATQAETKAETQAVTEAENTEALKAKLAEQEAELARLKDAQNNPAVIRPTEDVADYPTPELDSIGFERDHNGDLQKTGKHEGDVEVFTAIDRDANAQMKFMNEPVSIIIQETSEPDGQNPVFLSVNGQGALGKDGAWVPRNQEVTVKRMFVEVLLRAKRTDYTMRETIENGERKIVNDSRARLNYPFTVTADANPMGNAWRQKLMREL